MSQEKGVIGGGHLGEQLHREVGLVPIVLTASANGPDIDGLGKGTMIFGINLGTFTGTPTFDAKVQESSEGGGSGYTDAAATDMFPGAGVAIAQQSAGDQLIEIIVDTAKLKRYKRLVITIGGGSPVCPTSVQVTSHPTDRLPAA
jgi:hypothetical protein